MSEIVIMEKEQFNDEGLMEIHPVQYEVKMNGNRKPRIRIYENVRFSTRLDPSMFERVFKEEFKNLSDVVSLGTNGIYLTYQYGIKPKLFVNVTEDVKSHGHRQIKPKFYMEKSNIDKLFMAETQVCILLKILKKHHVARYESKSYSLQSRNEIVSRVRALKMLWNFLEYKKQKKNVEGWMD
jgi:hypothetical protein